MAKSSREGYYDKIGSLLPSSVFGSGLLAPKNIIHRLSSLIQKFLWQGSKNNENKFHLVNWKVVRKPRNMGDWQ